MHFIGQNLKVPASFIFALISINGLAANENNSASIRFVENKGQWDDAILYRMKFNVGTLFLEKDKLTYSLVEPTEHDHSNKHPTSGKGHAFKVHFKNCNPQSTAQGTDGYSDYENYFTGNDPLRWASGVQIFRNVKYHNLYPGIDLVLEEYGGHLKYSYVIQPTANPQNIKMRFEGVDALYLQDGNLHYATSVNSIREENLFAYQEINGSKVKVPCSFRLDKDIVSFEISGQYDHSLPLVIDPVLIFSTYTGSLADNFGFTAANDTSGNLYAGGIVFANGYPKTTGAYDTLFNGGTVDVSITKFTPDGSALVYSTYLGGGESEDPSSIIVNDNGELIVLGTTSSADFPMTASAYDASFNAGTTKTYPNNGPNFVSGTDIFVCKFNTAGTQLLGSTFIGGSANDGLNDNDVIGQYGTLVYNYGDQFRGEVLTDAAGNIYGVSSTLSGDFPVTAGAFQPSWGGGQDAVVFKFNSSLTSLLWSCYLGGSGADAGYNILVDDQNRVYMSGGTESSDFPATNGSLNPSYLGGRADGYIARISANGSTIQNATFIGTNEYDQSYFIDQDGSGTIYVVGQTDGNYPVSSNVYSNPNSGQYLTALTPDLSSIVLSTVFGRGDGDPDICPTAFLVDNCRNIYISGWAGNSLMTIVGSSFNSTTEGLPITADAYQDSTDKNDFYFMVLSRDAASLEYATFFGSPSARDHVDGGTSRFDKNGTIYQAVCAGCGGYDDFPTTPGVWSRDNKSLNFNCNEGLIKFGFDVLGVDVEVLAGPKTMGCIPLTVNFNAAVLNAQTLHWDFGDGATSTLANPVHTYNSTGTFIVTLIGIDTTRCDNLVFADTAQIAIVARDDSIAARFNPIIISNCNSFIVQIDDQSLNAASYIWNFGDGSTSTQPAPIHSYVNAGIYDISLIILNSTKCNPSDTLVKQVELIPNIDAGISIPDTFGCVPFTVNFFDASDGGVDFDWSFGDGSISSQKNPVHTYIDTGVYQVRLITTDSASCNINDSAFATVSVSDNRISARFLLDTLAFECDSLVISLTNQSSNFTSSLWNFGDGDTTTMMNPVHTFTFPDSFNITLIVSNPAACNDADTSAQIIFLPASVTAAFDADGGCPPHDVTVVSQSENAASFLWRYWDGTSTDSILTLRNLPPGIYSLMLTAYNPETCNDSSTVTGSFTVHDKPIAMFAIDDSVYNLFEQVHFSNQSTDAVTFTWSFADGDSAFIENPVHAYADSGTYIPCLTVSSEFGCDSAYCKMLEVEFVGAINVPNAFSPNGDGSNDMLYVRGVGVRDLEFRVYNRWGELVFESADADLICNELDVCQAKAKGWDGTYKGKPQEMDVYVYTLQAVFLNGKKSELKKGNITLIR